MHLEHPIGSTPGGPEIEVGPETNPASGENGKASIKNRCGNHCRAPLGKEEAHIQSKSGDKHFKGTKHGKTIGPSSAK